MDFVPRIVQDLKFELQSENFATFLKMLVEFMYWHFVAPLCGTGAVRHDPALRDAQFLSVYEDMLIIFERRKSRRASLLDLPIILVTMRVGLETVMRGAYPTWAATPDGGAVLRQMNDLLTVLLDPMDYLSHLPPIEASPQALKILHKRKLPARMPLSFTSPMVRFLVGQPQSREAKTLLCAGRRGQAPDEGHTELLQRLSPDLRAQIMQLITNHKLGIARESDRPKLHTEAAFDLHY